VEVDDGVVLMNRGSEEVRLKGLGVSPGIVRARVVVRDNSLIEPETYAIRPSDVPGEHARLDAALAETRRQIVSLQNQIRVAAGDDADIFDFHLLMLEDQIVLDQIFEKVGKEQINIESALYQIINASIEVMRKVQDPYLKERAVDLGDVMRRVLANLKPGTGESNAEHRVKHPHILAAADFSPTEIASMDRSLVLAYATETGNQTCHAAIIARSLGIPAVVGLHEFDGHFHTGDEVLLDGYGGVVITNPRPETIEHYAQIEAEHGAIREQLSHLVGERAVTTDGQAVVLSSNLEFSREIDRVRQVGAEGVGLYRTEFFYLDRTFLPEEDALFEDYGKVARAASPHGVIIRTLDAGGDKLPSSIQHGTEHNPFLGWRGIRVCLEEAEMFRTQLRAILRASAEGRVSIMFPLVSSLEELLEAKSRLEEAKASLRSDGLSFDEKIPVGVMIEVPSAVMIADVLAREVDFFSIGTNDLVQYTIAVDRVNERVAGLYAPHHPAIIRMIKRVAEAATACGIWAGVCGEMAGDVLSTPLLLGLGITELSVSPGQILPVKRAIRALHRAECEQFVTEILQLTTVEAINVRCRELALSRYPELLR
jgi:phosphotransferase system enzyme I (PtsI)